jgi:cytochrome c553
MHATRVSVAMIVALLASGLAFATAVAADAPAGAAGCTGCHAGNPRVETPVPPLAGRPAGDISAAMIAFKAGQRPGTIMDRIAKGFSDEEISAIAQWYAAQK